MKIIIPESSKLQTTIFLLVSVFSLIAIADKIEHEQVLPGYVVEFDPMSPAYYKAGDTAIISGVIRKIGDFK